MTSGADLATFGATMTPPARGGFAAWTEPGKVRLIGEVDASNIDLMTSALSRVVSGGRELLVDLSGLSFIDVGGTRELVALASRLAPIQVRVVGSPPQLGIILQNAGWENQLHIGADEVAP